MLLGLPILEVAIGLVLVFLFTSLICSAVNEMIEGLLKNRATDLEKGLRSLLQDPKGNGIVEQLYKHPLVFGLFKGDYHPKNTPEKIGFWHYLTPTNLPSYIPAQNFSRALLDIVLNPSSAVGASTAATSTPASLAAPPTGAPTTPAVSTPMTMANLQQAISATPNQYIKSALSSLVETAGRDINIARKNVEDWFDSGMDRVSGWYKRRTQLILLVLGLVVAVVFNVSTITIAHHLWIDAPLREAVVSKAALQKQPDSSGDAKARIDASVEALNELGLPIGWSNIEFKEHSVVSGEQTYSRRCWWPMSALGWLLTAFAVSFGAPFWFDLLNKFLVVRSTIKPEKKSLEDK